MRICVVSVAVPWLFGPYAQQASIVADGLLNRSHTVFWMPLPYAVQNHASTFTWQDLSREAGIASKPSTDEQRSLVKRLRFIGLPPQPQPGIFTVSSINRQLRHFKIDAIISLMDLDKLNPDETWAVRRSIAWYPNHFAQLDSHFKPTLSIYTDVASLCPTDAHMLTEALSPAGVNVSLVPHAIATPPVLARSAAAALRASQKASARLSASTAPA